MIFDELCHHYSFPSFRKSLSRRFFLQRGIAAAIPIAAGKHQPAIAQALPGLKPPVLRPGDTVGMVAPASNAYELEEIQIAKETMELYGFKVVLGKHINAQNGYLAGSDAQRAADVNVMFRRSDIRGIVPFSGGYGCSRILPLLDDAQIQRSPKIVVRHSDIVVFSGGL